MNENFNLFDPNTGLDRMADEIIQYDDNMVDEEMDFTESPFAMGDLLFDNGVVSIEEEPEIEEIDDASMVNAIYTVVEDNPDIVIKADSEEAMILGIQEMLLENAMIEVDLVNLLRENRESYPDTFNLMVGLWSGLVRTPKVYLVKPDFSRLFPVGVCLIYIPYNMFATGGGVLSNWLGKPILRRGTVYIWANKPIITNLKKTTIDAVASEFFALKYNRNIIDEIVNGMEILKEKSECEGMELEVFTPLEIVEMILEGDLDIDKVAKCVSEDKYRKVKRILELNSDLSGEEW